jgi:peptidoglycan hydrolase-like protein with peptidoglycan-binding domain
MATVWLAAAVAAQTAPAAQTTAGKDPATKKAVPVTSAKGKAVHRTASTKSPAAPTKTTVSSAAISKSASKTGSASRTGAKSKARVVARRPPLQQQPTVDRYREIQQALADKGYFRGTPDGAWNGESADALKRFQKDQNLDPDGKIGSLSLIALGLGPKRGAPVGANGEPVDPPPGAQP